jgi:hypothetical protein
LKYRWWEAFRERYDAERRRLTEAGIDFREDSDALARGVLRLHLTVKHNDEPLQLWATFPDLYPFFRFEIQIHKWNLDRHQNPFTKHICLFQSSTWNWRPSSDFLADFLMERVPKVHKAARSNDVPSESEEEPEAEPASLYFSPYSIGGVLVDEGWSFDTRHRCGNIRLGSMHQANQEPPFAVVDFTSNDGRILLPIEQRVAQAFGKSPIVGRWIYVDKPPIDAVKTPDLPPQACESLLEFARKNDTGALVASMGRRNETNLYAIIFPEERSQRGALTGLGWLFVARPAQSSTSRANIARKGMRRT